MKEFRLGAGSGDAQPKARGWRLSALWQFKRGSQAKDEQLQFLAQSVRLEEASNPRLVRLTASLISLSVLIFIVWAGVTNINEVARTSGEVVPLGFEQTVQHLDGGIVDEIRTQEGAVVESGDLLAVLNSGGAREDLRRAERKQRALEIQAERLRAFVNNRMPDFDRFEDLAKSHISEQRKVFDAMIQARRHQTNIVRHQITQKKQDLSILQTRQQTVTKNLVSLKDIHEAYRKLYEKGALSYVRLTETGQELVTAEGELDALGKQIQQSRDAISEFDTRLRSLSAVQKDEAYRELQAVETEFAQNQQIIEKLKRRVERLEVRAPVRGVIKGLAVNTIGGVVQPGQVLMSIVPLDQELVVETRIPPQHIGHISVGQHVQVKVSAYDYARYGALPGRLAFISATTFDDEKDRYYRGRVIFTQNYLGNQPAANLLLPGMTVMAEIITGEKTVLEYLLKPIHQAVSTAFSER